MIDAMLRDGLISETLGDYRLGDASLLIEDAATGLMLTTLVLTDAGLAAIGRQGDVTATATMPCTASHTADTAVPPQGGGKSCNAPCEAPVATTGLVGSRTTLRAPAAALVAAWDGAADGDARVTAIAMAVEAIRTHLAPRGSRTTAPRLPRHGTKQEAVLALLAQPDGTTIAQIIEITGWAPHTVRGFLAGLKKKGIKVDALEKVRQVGSSTVGAKGSYTIYRLGSAA